MMKALLMAGAAMIATPVIAQEMQASPQTDANTQATATAPLPQQAPTADSAADATTPATDEAATAAADSTAAPAATAPAQTAPAQSAATTAPAPAAPAQAAPAQSAAAEPATQPASTGDQVAQIVNNEFPTYDKDSTSSLNKDEFGSWMVALRSASDPSANAASAEMKTWVAQAFTSADANKDSAVSKDELTGFLSQGKS